jgi:hypothetical protein
MTKPPISLQDLRRRIYRKAKSDKSHRFWGLFGKSQRKHRVDGLELWVLASPG